MRIAVLAWDLPPHGSGLGRAAMEIARSLARAGNDVTVFESGRTYGETVVDQGMLIVGCSPPRNSSIRFLRERAMIGHLVAPWYFCKAVQAAHKAIPFDIIEATNWYAPAAFLSLGATPLVVRNSTPAIDAKCGAHRLRQNVDLWFAHQLEKLTARQASGLISNTPSHAELIENIYGIGNHPLHQVVSLALDENVLTRGAMAPLPSTKGPQSLLFVGRAERRKGFNEFLGGFAQVNRARGAAGRMPINLTTIGIDELDIRDHLEDQGENITILNSLSDDDLYTEFERATAVIAPSRYESFGLVYREAAAFGRPLITCAEDPAAKDFMQMAKCGILAESCTPLAIAKAIKQLLEQSEKWEEYALNGRRHVQRLTTDNLATQTLAVYIEAIRLDAEKAVR